MPLKARGWPRDVGAADAATTRMKTFLLVLLVGCQSSTVPVSSATTTSAIVDDSFESAARDIAHARCARELSCGNIDTESMDVCARDVRNATRGVISQRCPGGIGQTFLSTCLESVRSERCGTAIGLPERLVTTCRDVNLCP
jgi:hypothetical protein